jgi:hypothetical protein
VVAEPGRDVARLDADQRTRLRLSAVRVVVTPVEADATLAVLVLVHHDRWR